MSAFDIHPFVPPAESGGHAPVHPVVVVGAGPVGLTTALTLVRAGVPCVVLEDDERVCTGSRALGMSRRTLEIWNALDAAAPMLAHGRGWKGGRSFYGGKTILDFQMPDDPSLLHPPMFNLQQCHTEHYLVQALARHAHADLRWRSRVAGVEQDGDGVTLRVQTPDGEYSLRARYVAACDGARSAVRTALGLPLQGTSYEATYLIADIELDTDAPMERRCWFDPPSNPGLTVLMHGQPDGLWRLDYQLGEHEDVQQALQPDNVRRRIQHHLDHIGERGAWRLDWVTPYRVHSRALERFRHGRVAFAGDAAHLMPIFGIRGLNSGVEDAWNLGWKLAAVLRGAPDALLDAYSDERRAVFLENTALANRNAVFMTPPDPGTRLLRNAVLSLSLGDTPVQDILNPRQATYVPLRQSPLSTADAEAWDGGPPPGDLLPDLVLPAGHLQGLVQDRCLALCFLGAHAAGMRLADELATLPGLDVLRIAPAGHRPGDRQLVDAGGALHARFAAQDGAVYLVRPDHHVAARWKAPDARQVQAAMARTTARAAPATPVAAPLPPASAAERMYQALGTALAAAQPHEQALLLAKLVLRLGLRMGDAQAFENDLQAARAHMPAQTP